MDSKNVFISVEKASFTYSSHEQSDNRELTQVSVFPEGHESYIQKRDSRLALKDMDFHLKNGEFVVVLGRNGSGKSTLARMLNALLVPSKGVVLIQGIDTRDINKQWDVRKKVGMVFQNPDNQIVATVVEDDLAFGPENIGVEPLEIERRVEAALELVNLKEYKKHAPHMLSGGQRQRVSIAAIIAMKPQCIVLDEATAMLDPIGRRDIMDIMHKLNKQEGITVIHITHHMEEATQADRVVVMDNGKKLFEGTPSKVFSQVEKLRSVGLDVPQVAELMNMLCTEGICVNKETITIDAAVKEITTLLNIQNQSNPSVTLKGDA